MNTNPCANPYANRLPIRTPGEFFGRQKQLSRVFSSLANVQQPGAISVIGERRTGKSSLLQHVSDPLVYQQHLASPERYAFVYVDLQGMSPLTPEGFLRRVVDRVSLRVEGMGSIPPDLCGFEVMIDELGRRDLTLILLVDEFDLVFHEIGAAWPLTFFAVLRSLLQSRRLGMIIASRAGLRNILSINDEVYGSGFYNIFQTLYLGLMTTEEAGRLICDPARAKGRDLEPHLKSILEWAGAHPFFLQATCFQYFERIADGKPRMDTEEIRFDVIFDCKNVLDSLTSSLSPAQIDILSDVSQDASLPTDLQARNVARDLVKRGFLAADDGRRCGHRIFGLIFETHLVETLRNHTPGVQGGLPRDVREIVQPFETWIRGFVRSCLQAQEGHRWQQHAVKLLATQFGADAVARMSRSRDDLLLNSADAACGPTEITIFNATTLSELKDFITRNWGAFNGRISVGKPAFLEEMNRVIKYRNIDYHHNPVSTQQLRDLTVAAERIRESCENEAAK